MNTNSKYVKVGKAMVMASCLALSSASSVAQITETFTDSIVNEQLHFGGLSGLPLSLPKFNHPGAILLKAELSITTFSGTAEFKFENLNGVAVDVLRNEAYTVTATPVASEPGPFVLGAKTTYSTSLAKFDGNPDFGGSSGFTANIPLVVTTALPSITVTDSTVLANQYTGAGTLDWVVKDSSIISGILPNPNNVGYTAHASLVISVKYTYDFPVAGDCAVISAKKGTAITQIKLGANGGCGAPYTFSQTGLPAGLTLDPDGTIHGTPTVSGTFDYTVTVTDGCGNSGSLQCSVTVDDDCVPTGTATIGYWKNHPEAWPVSSIVIGGVTLTKAQAIVILGGSGSNASLLLAKQLIAAKLSAVPSRCNDSSCVAIDIVRADQLLALYPVGSSSPSASRNEILAIKTKLDDYNNGRLCEAHRN